ncbi:hypothetical protein WA026_007942 [Henosepilachna vigintioctopunctata]|uniref:Uncharacterized protein n=1 Tax=Henosepilachna vigintioctopunctata TaxID=420089 RepID=A0AAW1TRH9_9CUCU
MYPDDLETGLVEKCVHIQGHYFSERILNKPDSASVKSLSSILGNRNLEKIYRKLYRVFQLALCQEKLNALAIFCIESELMNILYDDIIDDFADIKSRKKVMWNLYNSIDFIGINT